MAPTFSDFTVHDLKKQELFYDVLVSLVLSMRSKLPLKGHMYHQPHIEPCLIDNSVFLLRFISDEFSENA
jgi:hypothetical protein